MSLVDARVGQLGDKGNQRWHFFIIGNKSGQVIWNKTFHRGLFTILRTTAILVSKRKWKNASKNFCSGLNLNRNNKKKHYGFMRENLSRKKYWDALLLVPPAIGVIWVWKKSHKSFFGVHITLPCNLLILPFSSRNIDKPCNRRSLHFRTFNTKYITLEWGFTFLGIDLEWLQMKQNVLPTQHLSAPK